MKAHFDLKITANYGTRIAEFFLRDSAGAQIGYQQTDFNAISVSQQRGLFDLRNYLHVLVDPGKERAAMAEIGVCIAEQVLGEEIFAALYQGTSPRTLRIPVARRDGHREPPCRRAGPRAVGNRPAQWDVRHAR